MIPLCSIIVLNWNGKKHLNDCFKSLKKIDYPKYEVIMADNGSTDGSVKFVKKKFPWVKVLKFDKNYGFAEGNNRAIKEAKGDYIIFLNNDTKVEKEWLWGLVFTANSSNIGICGSKVIDGSLGMIGRGSLNLLGIPDIRTKDDSESECFFVSGASLLIKRKVLRKLEYCFDPSYFAYFEDVDLCWRVRLLGYKVVYAPKSVAYHKGSGASKTMKFYHYRNKIWTFKKNLRFPLTQILMVPIAAITLVMYGIEPLKYMFSKMEKSSGLDRISLKEQLSILR